MDRNKTINNKILIDNVVAPRRGAWIEIWMQSAKLRPIESHPAGVRG